MRIMKPDCRDMGKVWDLIHGFFEQDDGSLPEIRIIRLTPKGVAEVYAFIRSQSQIASKSPSFWHTTERREVPIDAVPNAAALVVVRVAEPFHIVVGNLAFQNTRIPDLGMFIFQDQIAFDYRMGKEWGEPQVLALFGLLQHICNIDPGVQIDLEGATPPQAKRRFQEAWSTFTKTGGVPPR